MRALIVTYHSVEAGPPPLCVHPDLFRAHLETVVSSGARAVTVSELVRELRSPMGEERLVALTFDDGYASVVEHAAPLLLSYGLTATVFCVAGHLGGRNDWTTEPGSGRRSTLVSEEQVLTLAAAGHEIGSHGYMHAPATEASDAELERELTGSKEALERLTGTEICSYAYPYGAVPRHAAARKLVERAYSAACTTRVSFVPDWPDVHALPRVDAHYLRRPELLRRALEGSLRPYLVARRLGSQARRVLRKDYVTA